ncbi:UvrD-helicase domain-containing protein [Stenotrophomonas sp. 24(2023)]|uniref:UvrD-helicase domain-containing protein n=1 Tax=Stenotrophomonas sp. 24(2023) TaxID=3068324 RepID=UPI0027E176E1|nr:UvrD-helicase domain-containing protein [Stenotrophomonas sp. 24(2023)]WMJ68716.1 UvrD-helicase domain-containing protein [Stenotrophomonas sp. 24(2023)]
MANDWHPSAWGRRLTRSPRWTLRREGAHLQLHRDDGPPQPVALDDERCLRRVPGLFWSRLDILLAHGQRVVLDGLPNGQAAALERTIEALHAQHRQPRLDRLLQDIRTWLDAAHALIDRGAAGRRWITHEQQQALLQQRAALPVQEAALQVLSGDDLHDWQQDWPALWAQANAAMAAREQVLARDFLANVERQPLTAEQAHAVICFDNRVQVVASAGSGKTSTMVAKAAYAIDRGFIAPERIVMLAFNKDAAQELQARTDSAFARLGLETGRVQARTFHALGLHIIGKATGRKPDIPAWATDAQAGFRKLAELVDDLKDRSLHFRTQWDMFRLVFGRDLPAFGAALQGEGFERDGTPYVRTLQGERVKSLEECVIADWLFYNGVQYQYERAYEFDTATDTYRQYRPDFYYPDARLYHEHLALDARGNAPAHFGGYLDGVQWKRQEHRRNGTALIETTSHQLRSGAALPHLGEQLRAAAVTLDPNPDRELPDTGAAPMPDDDLIGLMRTFIAHAKSNSLGLDDLAERLRQMPEDNFKERHRRFLEIAGPVFQAWDAALAAENGIDFEDMLNLAASLLEQGHYTAPFDLVMADEFQDASRARARLCRALVAAPGRYLFAVGDDWQSINRFAGADVAVMTGFTEWFGPGQVLKLEQTFRCPQALCDASSRFIARNPAQLRKQVRSVTPAQGPALLAFQLASREQLQDGVRQYLAQLHAQLLSGQAAPGRDGRVRVFVLGRYNADRAAVPPDWQRLFGSTMEVVFLTAHRAKGAEADYVILPGLVARGFPSVRADDPVLSLAMPGGDAYPLGEERRLFYVALTRARRSVAMFTVMGRRSPFLDELVDDGAVSVTTLEGQAIHEQRCPACGTGVIVQRNGRHGPFQSCSGYPRCEYKPPRPRR